MKMLIWTTSIVWKLDFLTPVGCIRLTPRMSHYYLVYNNYKLYRPESNNYTVTTLHRNCVICSCRVCHRAVVQCQQFIAAQKTKKLFLPECYDQ
jgi:hypothetical protein